MLNIKVLASSSLAILAVVVLIAIVGYVSTNNQALLDFASKAFMLVLGGIVLVTVLINLPRIVNALK